MQQADADTINRKEINHHSSELGAFETFQASNLAIQNKNPLSKDSPAFEPQILIQNISSNAIFDEQTELDYQVFINLLAEIVLNFMNENKSKTAEHVRRGGIGSTACFDLLEKSA